MLAKQHGSACAFASDFGGRCQGQTELTPSSRCRDCLACNSKSSVTVGGKSDLHEMVGGQSVNLPEGRQASRHAKRAALVATNTRNGDTTARRNWLEILHGALGDAPLHGVMDDRRDLGRGLRVLEKSWLGCTIAVRARHHLSSDVGARACWARPSALPLFKPPSRLGGIPGTATEA